MDPTDKPKPEQIDPDQPIAWRAVPEDVEVRAQGKPVGSLYDLLGSHEEDIFHGIVVKLHSGRHVFVPADDVELLTAEHVDVGQTPEELGALPEHSEAASFDLRRAGLFKRVGWRKEQDR